MMHFDSAVAIPDIGKLAGLGDNDPFYSSGSSFGLGSLFEFMLRIILLLAFLIFLRLTALVVSLLHGLSLVTHVVFEQYLTASIALAVISHYLFAAFTTGIALAIPFETFPTPRRVAARFRLYRKEIVERFVNLAVRTEFGVHVKRCWPNAVQSVA